MLLARAKLGFLGEQPDDFFFCGEPWWTYTLARGEGSNGSRPNFGEIDYIGLTLNS